MPVVNSVNVFPLLVTTPRYNDEIHKWIWTDLHSVTAGNDTPTKESQPIIVHPVSLWFPLSCFHAHTYTRRCRPPAEAPAPCLRAAWADLTDAQSTSVVLCSSNSTVCWAAAVLWPSPGLLWRSYVLRHHSLWPTWSSGWGLTGSSSQGCNEFLLSGGCRNIHNMESPASAPDCPRALGKETDKLPPSHPHSLGTCTKKGERNI